jgi:tetratricopeptide (TPR) repeat protein
MAGKAVTFGTRLRRLRQARGWTQKDLAEPAYSDAYVSIIEGDRRQPSQEAIQYFAQKLGVDEEELLTGRPADLPIRADLDIKEARRAVSSGRESDAQMSLKRVLKEARRYGLKKLEAQAEQALGFCSMQAGDLTGAIARYERAESLLATEALPARIEAIVGKARCLRTAGDLHHAIYLLEQALEGLRRQDLWEADALFRIHASLVAPYFQSGATQKAEASAREALRLAHSSQEPEHLADMHMNVARVMLAQGRPEEAKESLQRAEELFRELEFQTEVAYCHLAQGYVLARDQRLEEAEVRLRLALEIFQSTGSRVDEAKVINELARIARRQGRRDEARRLLDSSVALLGDDADVPELALALRELGLAEVDEDHTAAEKYFREAIVLYKRMNAAIDLAVTYRLLGDLLCTSTSVAAGMEAYRSGLLSLETAGLSDL